MQVKVGDIVCIHMLKGSDKKEQVLIMVFGREGMWVGEKGVIFL